MSYDAVLVTQDNIHSVVDSLKKVSTLGIDTETYGLGIADRMFALQISTQDTAYYFNFHKYDNPVSTLCPKSTVRQLADVFNDTSKVWYAHNAKFEMHKLADYGVELAGKIRDTVVWARLIWNVHFQYSLDACLKRIGLAKDDEVEKYISKNKCYTMVSIEGKTTKVKLKHYEQVPFPIMFKYGCMDAWGVLQLGNKTHKDVDRLYDYALINREEQLTKATFKMERRGARVDREYTKHGREIETRITNRVTDELTRLSGRPFKNGPKWLRETFDQFGIEYAINEKTNNPKFDKKELAKINHPIAGLVREYRRSTMYSNTYYSTILEKTSDESPYIYANIKTGGTDTLRFSYSSPNLQNVPKEDSDDYDVYVRKNYVPRDGFNIVAIDFRQQEFRLMLDYANEKRLIDAVNNGEDLHQATADLVGCSRKHAKTVNFGLLYGMGVETLAVTLGISVKEAKTLKELYFARFPKIEFFIDRVIRTAKTRKYIKTWTGRLLRFPNKDYAYKAPNHLIQGGCADMVREAIVQCDPILEAKRSGILIQVHDELVFEIAYEEMNLVPLLKDTMKNIYTPFNGMLMDCSVEISDKSWGYCDMQEVA